MVVLNRISYLRGLAQNGAKLLITLSANAQTGVQKVKVLVDPKQRSSNQSCALGMLDLVALWHKSHKIADKGHRHTNGMSEVSFYITTKNAVEDDEVTDAAAGTTCGGDRGKPATHTHVAKLINQCSGSKQTASDSDAADATTNVQQSDDVDNSAISASAMAVSTAIDIADARAAGGVDVHCQTVVHGALLIGTNTDDISKLGSDMYCDDNFAVSLKYDDAYYDWAMSSLHHLLDNFPQLSDFSKFHKQHFQEAILDDQLECAIDRLRDLVKIIMQSSEEHGADVWVSQAQNLIESYLGITGCTEDE
jgi:hypothetical protein